MSRQAQSSRLPRLYSLREASEQTGLPYSTLYDRVTSGELPVIRVTDRALRVAEDDLLRWIDSRREVVA